MKVNCTSKEIQSFVKELEIEHEGEIYRATITYDTYSGYELAFYDKEGKGTSWPEWALEWEDKQQYGGDSLEYQLDCDSGNWVFTDEREVEVA